VSRDRCAKWPPLWGGSFWVLTLSLVLVVQVAEAQASPKPGGSGPSPNSAGKAPPAPPSPTTAYQLTPKQPGVVKLKHGGHTASLTLKKNGAIAPEGLDALADALQDKSGSKHAVDPRFADLLVTVSDHFGGRAIEVMGGYRPPPAHSNHTVGKAMDLRVEGVPVEAVRDYCQTLDHAGVGYYPGGKFVHLDWRNRARQWTDTTPLMPVAKSGSTGKGSTHTPPPPTQGPNNASGTKQSPTTPPPTPHK
jgi:uncharacterized protein YcbK (DUF882 family)